MRYITFPAVILVALSLTGCPNPNAIGVQRFGSIEAHVTSSGQPVADALVSVGSTDTCRTDSSGVCRFPQIAIGKQVVLAYSGGLRGSAETVVNENQTSRVDIPLAPSN